MGRKKIYTEEEARDRRNAYRRKYAKENRDIMNAQKERYRDGRAHKEIERLKTLGEDAVSTMIAIVLERTANRSFLAGERNEETLQLLKKNDFIESYITGKGLTAVILSPEWLYEVGRKEEILLDQIDDYWHK